MTNEAVAVFVVAAVVAACAALGRAGLTAVDVRLSAIPDAVRTGRSRTSPRQTNTGRTIARDHAGLPRFAGGTRAATVVTALAFVLLTIGAVRLRARPIGVRGSIAGERTPQRADYECRGRGQHEAERSRSEGAGQTSNIPSVRGDYQRCVNVVPGGTWQKRAKF